MRKPQYLRLFNTEQFALIFQDLKLRIIEVCLIVLITIIIVPYSGWTKTAAQSNAPIPSIKWSTVFRNASGVLRNVSSAGPEARRVMRDCDGLVDSFVWIIKAPIGKNDIDNKVKKKREILPRYYDYNRPVFRLLFSKESYFIRYLFVRKLLFASIIKDNSHTEYSGDFLYYRKEETKRYIKGGE